MKSFVTFMLFGSIYLTGLTLPAIAGGRLPLDISGVSVIPHVYSKEIRYSRPVSEELGSLVRLFIMHRDKSGQPVELKLTFNGKKPSELLADEAWTWYEMPENLADEGKAYILGPGKLGVFTFNGKTSDWGIGKSFNLTLFDERTGVSEIFDIPIMASRPQVTYIACLTSEKGSIYPDKMLIHLANETEAAYQINSFRIYAYNDENMEEFANIKEFSTFTKDGILPPNDRAGAMFHCGKLPLTHGALETVLKDSSGKEISLWSYLRFKRDQFDIGSGWLDIPSRPGIPPVTKESYLKLLRRVHVNLAHIEHIPGYTDSTGENGLYTRYPLLMMSGFGDIDKYNTDEWVAKIHGVDAVGEPQMGQEPEDTYKALRNYDLARYPTTLTLSQDSGFRYYAGLSDFPHFDAYRVTAPAADTWWLYDRWEDGPVLWGAPLEGIGEMTRTLRVLSRPLPIALWSQNISGGWEGGLGRKRRSPTADEILVQAYEGLANGVTGLYWYSLQTWSVLKYRDTIDMTTRIGREIRLLEDLYVTGDAYKHKRINANNKPDLDLSSVVTPESALLFAIDLNYRPDRKAQVFFFQGERTIEASFDLPGYLQDVKDLFRVNADGIYDMEWESIPEGVKIKDNMDRVGVYVVTKSDGMRDRLKKRLEELIAMEESVGFDPAKNDQDFILLMHDLGIEQVEDIGPAPEPNRPISESGTNANPVYLTLEPAVGKELNLTEDQIDSIYQMAQAYQLDLYKERQLASDESESSENLSQEERRQRRNQQRERWMEIAERLLPAYYRQLEEILKPEQIKRLDQIRWQAAGMAALEDEKLIATLGITEEQQDKLSAIGQDYNQRRMMLYRSDLSRNERQEKTAELNKNQIEEAMKVLSEEQMRKFDELKGKVLEI